MVLMFTSCNFFSGFKIHIGDLHCKFIGYICSFLFLFFQTKALHWSLVICLIIIYVSQIVVVPLIFSFGCLIPLFHIEVPFTICVITGNIIAVYDWILLFIKVGFGLADVDHDTRGKKSNDDDKEYDTFFAWSFSFCVLTILPNDVCWFRGFLYFDCISK